MPNLIIGLLIALTAGGGVSVAAESAVPGDTLYPMKVSINEGVRGWVAVSDEAEAKWQTRLSERRLEEAEELAADGELSLEKRERLENRFQESAERIQAIITAMEEQDDAVTEVMIHSEMEASLRAHEQVLARLAVRLENDTQTREQVLALLSQVRSNVAVTSQARARAESRIVNRTGENALTQEAAVGKRGAAENKLEETVQTYERRKGKISVEAQAQVESMIASSGVAYELGSQYLEQGSNAEAFLKFQECLRFAQEAKIIANTSAAVTAGAQNRNAGSNTGEEQTNQNQQRSGQDSSNAGVDASVGAEVEVEGSTEGDTSIFGNVKEMFGGDNAQGGGDSGNSGKGNQ
jgi:hypothetical protein